MSSIMSNNHSNTKIERPLEVVVYSGKKGSNHGGRCIIPHNHLGLPVYLKHCMNSSIRKGMSSFTPMHQPVYEAVTFAMLNQLGLHTPNFYVLLNGNRDIKFSLARNSQNGEVITDPDSQKHIQLDIKPGMPYYFVTEIINKPQSEDVSAAEKIIQNELIYLEFLQVSDIVGTKQNYIFQDGKVFYLDLGCTFVDAHNGVIALSHKHGDFLCGKELKKTLKNLSKVSIVGKGAYRSLSLEDLTEMPRDLQIPTLNPYGRIPLYKLISPDEIDEISARLASGIERRLKKKDVDSCPYLFRSNSSPAC